ncbi:heavy metal translocating P-type ATPase metal-binding domain-containing protein [Methylomicrobium sp. Wu6]|uniref:heavy metal translocating P-type ATPase metal-binding domain-containing protein n=1 Tax=Methylomicrobium sp. Wu6 TaxID=3107928 RepID=UPI002DD6A50F|nr:heavy metal translocating P-type ATPase metal-binding domain-containing protein [Methylomicrobium sp. Wu6]MEC4747669.1 heavy metal translocating P-type ATPase metal-binding domain-containing protein [Methylomicrobium sp. Wu6]
MTKVKYRESCVLCGQPVEIAGFTLETPDGISKFCCAGCLSIYQLLNDKNLLSTSTSSPKNEDKE